MMPLPFYTILGNLEGVAAALKFGFDREAASRKLLLLVEELERELREAFDD